MGKGRQRPGGFRPVDRGDDKLTPAALLPFGIAHHYCKLAVLTAEADASGELTFSVEDCRKKFPPLTELPAGGKCCCSVSVGENGDFPDIQSAIDARPADASEWRICVMEGLHQVAETVAASDVSGLVISGCGRQTHILGPQDAPVFAFEKAKNVQIENLWIDAFSATGAILFKRKSISIEIRDCLLSNQLQSDDGSGFDVLLEHEVLRHTRGRVGMPAPLIVIDNGTDVTIHDNYLYGLPAIQGSGINLFVLRNRIEGGGVQIVPPTGFVQIEDNTILKGLGPGIQLGGGEKDATYFVNVSDINYEVGLNGAPVDTPESPVTPMYDESAAAPSYNSPASYARNNNPLAGIRFVTISRNLIGKMRGSGIVTALELTDLLRLSDVETLVISDNQIISCCKQPDVHLNKSMVGGGMALVGVFNAQIDHNFIASNGSDSAPACGIFVMDGSAIDIDDNIIVENGAAQENPEPDSYQAGIAAHFVNGNYLGIGKTEKGKEGSPAIRIRGNEVICPAGQALTIMAVGGVVVDGNTLATRERLKQPTAPLNFGEKGACVAILDLGLPIWLPDIALLLQMMSTGNTDLHLEDNQLEDAFAKIPDGRVLFHNNQVTFNTDIKEDVESQGDMNAGWPQRIWNAATFAALIISLDDVSLNANQFQASAPAYMLDGLQRYLQNKISLADFLAFMLKFIHVGSGAITARATGNGLVERWVSNGVSYASNAALMNITTSNEATHALVTNAPKRVQEHNLSLTS